MKKVLILGNQPNRSGTSELSHFKKFRDFYAQATTGMDLTINFTLLSDVIFFFTNGTAKIFDDRNKTDLAAYEAVYIKGQYRRFHRLDALYVISNYLKAKHRAVVDDYGYLNPTSKLSQLYDFCREKMAFPDAICGPPKLILKHHAKLSFPVVCKDVYAAHGDRNFLVKNEKQLKQIVTDNPDVYFVLQQYIPNEGDYRVFFLGGKCLVIKRSGSESSHLNNTSKGGQAQIVPTSTIPAKYIRQSLRFMKHAGLGFAGVDLVFDSGKNKFLYLEVNEQPQMISGAFVAEKQKLLRQYFEALNIG